jgi:hypothetical protein
MTTEKVETMRRTPMAIALVPRPMMIARTSIRRMINFNISVTILHLTLFPLNRNLVTVIRVLLATALVIVGLQPIITLAMQVIAIVIINTTTRIIAGVAVLALVSEPNCLST